MIIRHLESDKTNLQAQLQDLSLSCHAVEEELEAQNWVYGEKASLLAEAQGEVLHLKDSLAYAEERATASHQTVARIQLEIEKM